MALPALDELEIELKGEAQGWLNATCTYYDLGWISEEQGRYATRRLTTFIKCEYLGDDAVNRAGLSLGSEVVVCAGNTQGSHV